AAEGAEKLAMHVDDRTGARSLAPRGHRWADRGALTAEGRCPSCSAPAIRPDVVWFGEIPYHMERIGRTLEAADLFVSIGTSGEVYPAAGFVAEARTMGLATLELNLEPSAGSAHFDEARHGPATEVVPAWVAEVLGEG
ncbi:MAG: Sir2 family NAD-dependent protein deacetylase, partial [Pseudomonadota bacterium]